jgi:phospholipase/carboxylesterase
MTRRRFAGIAGGALAGFAVGCRGTAAPLPADGRINARPRTGATKAGSGTQPLGIGGSRDAILQLPSTPAVGALPLLVFLHGATQNGAGMLRRIGPIADELGIAVLAPDSRESSWDAIRGEFGPDVEFLNRALERVFSSVAVDPARVAVGGFSDGATYALSLGLINGDLFPRVVAFSPGFVVGGALHGKPRFFISHGTEDTILPIDRCSRVLVPRLRQGGYDVTFREFSGGHGVPPEIGREGLKWMLASTGA